MHTGLLHTGALWAQDNTDSPQERFAKDLASDDPTRWDNALRDMDVVFKNYRKDFTKDGYANRLLKLLADPKGSEQRTRMILASQTVRAPDVGADLLFEVLGLAEPHGTIEAAIGRVQALAASDEARMVDFRARMLGILTGDKKSNRPQNRGEEDCRRLERLFTALWQCAPSAVLHSVFEWLQEIEADAEVTDVEKAVLSRLDAVLNQALENRKIALEWWAANRERSVLELIVGERERRWRKELQDLWMADALVIQGQDAVAYRAWLIESLDRQDGIRKLALQKLQQFARALPSTESNPENRRRILEPAFARLLTLYVEVPSERRAILDAIADFTDFGDREDGRDLLVSILEPYCNAEPTPKYGAAGGDDYTLALRALRAAQRLASPMVESLEASLQVAIGPDGTTWSADKDEFILAVMEGFRSIGVRSEAVPLMAKIFDAEPRSENDTEQRDKIRLGAVSVLMKHAGNLQEDTSRRQALEVFQKSLESAGRLVDYAIIGLGNLGMREGIPLLEKVVRDSLSSDGKKRKDAITCIQNIGGVEAAASLRDLRSAYEEGPADLKQWIREAALQLCASSDEVFKLLLTYTMASDGAPLTWFEETVEHASIAQQLDSSSLGENPEAAFADWLRLRRQICDVMATRTAALQKPTEELTASRALADSAKHVLEYVQTTGFGDKAEDTVSIRHHYVVSHHRAAILVAFEGNNVAEVQKSIDILIKNPTLTSEAKSVQVDWLLERIERMKRVRDKAFLAHLRKLCADNEVALSERAVELFESFEQNGTVVETSVDDDTEDSNTAEPGG